MPETIMRTILEASFTAGIATLAVILLRIPLKKVPKRWSNILWVVVFFRCLCPFSIESTVSLFNAVPQQSISPANNHSEDVYDNAHADSSAPVYTDPSDYAGSTTTTPIEPNAVLFYVWVSGAAIMALYAIISYGSLKIRMRTAVKTEDGVYETDLISTAFSVGFFPPKIYIPCRLSKNERRLITAHERVHIRRLDFIAKPLAFVALILHWFNPLIWIAFVLMTKDMEFSCDEAVLKTIGSEEKQAYSQALLQVSMKQSGLPALPLAFAQTGIKERVKNVLKYKKPGIIGTVLAAVIVLAACAVLGTNAKVYSGDLTPAVASLWPRALIDPKQHIQSIYVSVNDWDFDKDPPFTTFEFSESDSEYEQLIDCLSKRSYHFSAATLGSAYRNSAGIEGSGAGYALSITYDTDSGRHTIVCGGTGKIIVDSANYRIGYWGNREELKMMEELRQIIGF